MIRTLWRAGLAGRLAMVASVAVIAAVGRTSAVLLSAGAWAGSERQAMYGVLVMWLVLPVFVAMLGATLLRGEHAPWAWGLARPISRRRLMGSIVALDAITIALCVCIAAGVLGGFAGSALHLRIESAELELLALHGLFYSALYLSAATAGASTSSSARAAAVGVALLGGASALFVVFPREALAFCCAHLVRRGWLGAYLDESISPIFVDHALLEPFALAMLGIGVGAAALPIGLVLGFLRAARSAPARPHIAHVVRPALVAVAVATALVAGAGLSLWARAPSGARFGHVSVDIVPKGDTAAIRMVHDVWLEYDTGLVFHGNAIQRASSPGTNEAAWKLENVSPGDYVACAALVFPPEPPLHRGERDEACSPVLLTDAPVQRVEIDVGPAHVRAVPRP